MRKILVSINDGHKYTALYPEFTMIKRDNLRFFFSALVPSFILKRYFARLKVDCDIPLDLRKFLLFRKILKSGDFAIDVGAHIGAYSKFFAKMVGPTGLVSAFEPNPYAFYILKKHTINTPQIKLYPDAVSNIDDTFVKLKIHPLSLAQSSTIEEELKSRARMPGITVQKTVLCRSLGKHCESQNKKVKFIKIDAEGHDDAVVLGAMTTIEKDRPYVMCEGFKDFFDTMVAFKSLSNRGYTLIDVSTLAPANSASMPYCTDVLAVPNEQMSTMEPFLEALKELH